MTHFSATCCMSQSSVVMILQPAALEVGHVSASPHSLVASSSRTAQTKCGACHCCVLLRVLRGEDDRLVLGALEVGWALYWSPVRTRRVGFVGEQCQGCSCAARRSGMLPGSSGTYSRPSGAFDRVAHQVVRRRRLGQRGQQRDLAQRQLVQVVDAEVALRPRP